MKKRRRTNGLFNNTRGHGTRAVATEAMNSTDEMVISIGAPVTGATVENALVD